MAAFATRSKVTEAQAYRYLSQYGALALCEKHYGIMHTLSLDENIQTIKDYCHGYVYSFLAEELTNKD